MGMTIRFLRNKVVEVEPLSDGSLAVSWRLTDDLLKAEVVLRVQPPDLEILEAEARLERLPFEDWPSAPELIKQVEGVRVGPGLRKIVAGLLGGPQGCSLLAHAVLEASNAVILHFTRPGLEAAEAIEDEALIDATREMLKHNPRLIRSCVAFQDDSPIMRGLDLEGATK
jgi:hypothetical protein